MPLLCRCSVVSYYKFVKLNLDFASSEGTSHGDPDLVLIESIATVGARAE